MKIFITIFLTLFLLSFSRAQIITSFENDSLDGWRSEGDGKYYLEAGVGNPGICMRIDDDATGDTNLGIAPFQYVGNWAAADTSDSIMVDIFVSKISGTLISDPWLFRISGPGGSAISPGVTPGLEEWEHFSVPLDSSVWKQTSGTWQDLMAYVNHMEVRGEFINGDEFVRLDNIELSFSPKIVPVNPPVLSDFEGGTYEGWAMESSGGVSIPTSGGNPGRYLRIADGASISMAIAPPKFLGDWTMVDEKGSFGV